MTSDWRDLLVAWLHDPPDKALDIKTHQARARRYASAALGDQVSDKEQKDLSDSLAAIAERLPCPHWSKLTVGVEEGQLRLRHPLSGADRVLQFATALTRTSGIAADRRCIARGPLGLRLNVSASGVRASIHGSQLLAQKWGLGNFARKTGQYRRRYPLKECVT